LRETAVPSTAVGNDRYRRAIFGEVPVQEQQQEQSPVTAEQRRILIFRPTKSPQAVVKKVQRGKGYSDRFCVRSFIRKK
jgi:hypothetical protein